MERARPGSTISTRRGLRGRVLPAAVCLTLAASVGGSAGRNLPSTALVGAAPAPYAPYAQEARWLPVPLAITDVGGGERMLPTLPDEAVARSVAVLDLDGDGALELAVGYRVGDGGVLAVWRGVRSVQRPGFGAMGHAAAGAVALPFAPSATIHPLAAPPEILLAGDFDADGRDDLAHTSPGADRVHLLLELERERPASAELVLPGRVLEAIAGEINRRDGLEDLIVAVDGEEGARLVVYEGWRGASSAVPETVDLPGPPEQLLLGDFDRSHPRDLALRINGNLHLLVGRDRRLAPTRAAPSGDERRDGVPAPSLIEVDGAWEVAEIALGRPGERSGDPYRELLARTPTGWAGVVGDEWSGRWELSEDSSNSVRLGAGTAPAVRRDGIEAELTARLDADAVDDRVVLLADRQEPWLRLSAAGGGGIAVNSNGDDADGDVGDGVCDTGSLSGGFTGLCTLRAAIQEHNTGGFGRPIVVGTSPAMPIQPLSGLPAITVPVDLSGGGVIDGSMCAFCTIGILLSNAESSSVSGLVIQGFSVGLQINNGDGNLISANRVGTDATGSMKVGIPTSIALLNSSENTFFDNVVAGPITMIFAGSHTNTFVGNFTGVSPTSGADLGLGGINGSSGGGDLTVVIGNVIASGGVEIEGGGGDGSRVEDNIVGSDDSVGSVVGNSDHGIRLVGVDGATVRANRVVGQTSGGITVSGDSPVVAANRVGVDFSGTAALPNANGIGVGGADATVFDNVVSGNTGTGIDALCQGGVCTVVDNRVGTDATGSQALGNGLIGISFGAFGGAVEVRENVVAANGSGGIRAGVGTAQVISGNLIGTDQAGSAPLGNGRHGILLQSQGSFVLGNQIADTQDVAGVQGHGLEIQGFGASGNVVEGNLIGVAGDGATPMGNQGHGILLNNSAPNNRIGGGGGKGNVIAHNGLAGVAVGSGTGNTVSQNTIFENGGLGIDHSADGPTPNDPGDGDGGANNRQNAPTIVDLGGSKSVSLASHPNETFQIELFANDECDPTGFGEGQSILGFATLTTDGAGNGSVLFPFGAAIVSATATRDSTGDTSEFSPCASRPATMVNSQRDLSDAAAGNGACDTGFQVTILGQQRPECTLRAAIQEANAAAGDDVILFDPNGPGEPGAAQDGEYLIRPGSSLPLVTGTTRIGGAPGSQQVDVDGLVAGAATDGLRFAGSASRSEVRDLAIYRFTGEGIDVDRAPGFKLVSSYLGTDRAGTAGRGNGRNGLRLNAVQGGEVGGPTGEERNVISANDASAILVLDSVGVVVHGGNQIGTDPDGSASLGNGGDGIELVSTRSSRIGSPGPDDPSNLIAGSGGVGISLTASHDNLIVGNNIGEFELPPLGLFGAPNDLGGVLLTDGSRGNRIVRNEIVSNSLNGIVLAGVDTERNVVSKNRVAGNGGGDGIVLLDGAHDNRIELNVVFANAGGAGIGVKDSGTVRNELTGNEIKGHAAGLGIDLAGDGVTANDTGDGDAGPNHRQNFPVIRAYTAGGIATGALSGPPGTTYRIELYLNESCDPSGHGEAERLAVTTTATTDVTGNAAWRAVPGIDPMRPFLTALAIRQPGAGGTAFELDTSELSACYEVDSTPVVPTLLINEVDADPGPIPRELVELLFRGAGAASLVGKVVVFFDGETDTSYAAFDLDGEVTDAQGRFVLGNADVAGVDLVFDDFLLQDGPDAVAVYQANGSDFPNGTPVTTVNLLDAVVYGSGDPDPGLLVLLAADQPQLDEAGGGRATLHSLQRCPDGAGEAGETEGFAPAPPTPDDANRCLRCQIDAFDSLLAPDPLLRALVREDLSTPVAGATVYFEVIAGPSAGALGAAITDSQGVVSFEIDRPAGACGADTVEASGMFDGLPFVCRSQACAWCSADADLILADNPTPGPALFSACGSITAGTSFVVSSGDDVTFRTRRVILTSGFRVETGGSFAVDLDSQP
ncbi:MAG TPA: right-handed parallel beta-helix repeat-containing protein [Thermoanaerobaculia bacterium]|nr:right-handed parallel beta-helix repeat-containing protein [Thermoanaerobaculia bacterium]